MEWTSEWPTEKGLYWFYGYTPWEKDELVMYTARVYVSSNGSPVYLVDAAEVYRDHWTRGMWSKIEVPKSPDVKIERPKWK